MTKLLHHTLCVTMALVVLLSTGCVSQPYVFSENVEANDPTTLQLRPDETQFERGKPVPLVDGLGHYFFSLPSKLILWSWRVDNHDIAPETEEILRTYLHANGLENVKVRVNQYAPGAEWSRLSRNQAVPGFFRWTLGLLTTVSYTIMPGRLFGGDNYNPWTNTLNLYSDHPSIALHEGGHAKDFASRSRGFRGWYGLIRILPIVPLYQEYIASSDAISYHRGQGDLDSEKADYKILYPAYGTYVGGEGVRWINVAPVIYYSAIATGALIGHAVGRTKAANLEEEVNPGVAINDTLY